jgi:hypothetical protein
LRVNREQERQIRTALQLIAPMGEMIEAMHKVILAHHPAAVHSDDCPVCQSFQDELEPIMERWANVRALAGEWLA